jgi:glutamate-ammonia-ligase adenylyltransferase
LARLGFSDADRARQLLAEAALDPALLSDFSAAANPDLAVLSFSRLSATAPDREELLAQLGGNDVLRARLVGVLGASTALGEHLVAHPEDWRLLAHDRPPPDLAADGVDGLRLAYLRQLLVIAGCDMAGECDVDAVAADLAVLADATVDAALAIARTERPSPARLAVIGMGKCGGRELNYVSDVDVIFVAEPADGQDETAALRDATALASRTMEICGEVAWQVDAALRPEGKHGPLVRTLASHEAYYRRWARTWEFQALLKARPIAGDIELGQEYLDRVSPLVWTAAERDRFVEDVQAMRRRVEQTLPAGLADRELKLGRGGLRDVEFAVQLLQLVHGRADERLRTGSTLEALTALSAGGYVGRDDAASLDGGYRFLRLAEHRLQLQHLRRTHLLPEDPAGLRWLARAMGLKPDRRGDVNAVFAAEHAGHAHDVRRLHEKLFYRPLLSAVAHVPSDQLALTTAAARTRLTALGFSDPEGALRHIAALTAGVSRRAAIQKALLPALLGSFADSPDPDAGLLGYRQVSDALGATPWYLRLLRDEGLVADRLARLLGGSRYVADLLVRAPDALPMLADDSELRPRELEALKTALAGAVERTEDPAAAIAALRALRRGELLRVACADLLGMLDVVEVGRALSAVATATVDAALRAAIRSQTVEPPARLAVIAMGRLGGREAGYGSDVDALFVYEPIGDDAEARVWAESVVRLMVSSLAAPAPDPPLEVDADLRPEGRSGPLVRSLAGYAAYYQRHGAAWEAQALLRADPIAGDAELGRRFIEMINPVRYPPGGLAPAATMEIRRLKARVDAERLPRGADPATHTKLGRGGLADVEWTVQLLQLQHAGRTRELRTPSTVEALAASAASGLLPRADAVTLETAWRLASAARNAVMLVRGRGDDQLPRQGRSLMGVMWALGCSADEDPGKFLDDYRRATRRARRVVERVFYA